MTAPKLDEIAKPTPTGTLSADQALVGPQIPPQQRILVYSPDDWTECVHEWVHARLRKQYKHVSRFDGAGDMGVDVAGFADKTGLAGVWDNFQCKRYGHALRPAEGLVEIGKMLWYAFNGNFAVPRRYTFVAPQGLGITLKKLVTNPPELKKKLIADWDKVCRSGITDKQEILLEGKFLAFVEAQDFSIFGEKTALQLVEDFKNTPYYAARFGGGLPARPRAKTPPSKIAVAETVYVTKLFTAYTQHAKELVSRIKDLTKWPKLKDHFGRQRIAFYHAESLRVFARDTVPPGTFESLQDDIHAGVSDVHAADHDDGYQRVIAVTKAARELEITENALITRAKPQDRDGICHQLANDDRLDWTDKK
ncbi:ABC-three component system protein [Pseudolabrys sp.]|uniref:ABC-three component system protein n=1 Tax=Pseudolabrys sp. TaxID=1960880 RepID=UPI003D0BFE31